MDPKRSLIRSNFRAGCQNEPVDAMTDIVTITPSPAVDLSTSVDKILPVAKLRGQSQRRDPGGGKIDLARVIGGSAAMPVRFTR